MNLWHIIFFIFCFVYKIQSSKIRPNFDAIFGQEWDKNESVSIENREEMGTESIDQMQIDQNIFKSDQNDQNIFKNGQNMKEEPNDRKKRKMIQKFEAIKEKMKQKGNFRWKNRVKIETKIGKLLGANREKIYKWKKELNLNKKKMMENSFCDQKKKKFIERFDEFKSLYGQRKQKEFAKELGISKYTFWKWKKELRPKYNKTQNKYSIEDKLQKMKQYFKIKEKNPKISDETISKQLKIGSTTLATWKKKFASVLEK